MRKIFNLIASCFFVLLACVAFAWDDPFDPNYRNPALDPEKIYLFDVKIDVQTNGSINITENITLNAKHQQIRRGIYRDIPVSFGNQLDSISLTMDGQTHPFFTENKGRNLRVNFGNDNYIPQGRHTYSFNYTYKNAIKFFKNYDELYWNITGNDWNFVIDKARAQVNLPANARVQSENISLYTGPSGAKESNARQVGTLTFETTRPLSYREGFTIAVPFDKGAVEQPPFLTRLKDSFSFSVLFSFALFIFLIIYAVGSWLKVGRDPVYPDIAYYEPPKDISPAFTYFLYNKMADSKFIACILLDLAMKGYIEIQTEKGTFGSVQISMLRKKPAGPDLPQEEKMILNKLFGFAGGDVCNLDYTTGVMLNAIMKQLHKYFAEESKAYIVGNGSYIVKAVIIVALLGIVPFIFTAPEAIFINLHFSVFFVVFPFIAKNPLFKILIRICIIGFYSLFWMGMINSPSAFLCLVFYIASLWGLGYYMQLIPNVTPLGRDIFEKLNGFKKYIKTAEVNRFAVSNPMDEEKIFCDYLPYAFAMGLENQWIKKFTNTLSQATIDKCVACAGGVAAVSGGLASGVGSSMPSGSGSGGGGCSGGGGGGGGGGGR
ncbi:MAG: DUF2207 domain-containing protein [Elusimicrobiaceae bacterium]|nr:DUF2207 domain-containing protein [Elusimicrobiaceae bacterium]